MGLTKQYLRYVPAGNLNIIISSSCNVVFVTLQEQEGRFVAVGACEHVFIWDLRLGEKVNCKSFLIYILTIDHIIIIEISDISGSGIIRWKSKCNILSCIS